MHRIAPLAAAGGRLPWWRRWSGATTAPARRDAGTRSLSAACPASWRRARRPRRRRRATTATTGRDDGADETTPSHRDEPGATTGDDRARADRRSSTSSPASSRTTCPTGWRRRTLRDDSGRLRLDVPREWSQHRTEPARFADGSEAPSLAASPDLTAFLDGYATPGMTALVVADDPDRRPRRLRLRGGLHRWPRATYLADGVDRSLRRLGVLRRDEQRHRHDRRAPGRIRRVGAPPAPGRRGRRPRRPRQRRCASLTLRDWTRAAGRRVRDRAERPA